jgi:hypothetical protein
MFDFLVLIGWLICNLFCIFMLVSLYLICCAVICLFLMFLQNLVLRYVLIFKIWLMLL